MPLVLAATITVPREKCPERETDVLRRRVVLGCECVHDDFFRLLWRQFASARLGRTPALAFESKRGSATK